MKTLKSYKKEKIARNAWLALSGLVALGTIVLTIRELPSMRRELKLLRM